MVATPGPATGQRLTPSLGKIRTTRTALTRPSTARVSKPTREHTLSRGCTETLPARPRPPTRPQQPPTRPPLRRTPRHHNRCPPTQTEENEVHRSPTTTNRLNAKLGHCADNNSQARYACVDRAVVVRR